MASSPMWRTTLVPFSSGTSMATPRSSTVGRSRSPGESVRYVRPMWQRIGTTVMGRHLFDLTNGWEGVPPAGEHIVVVTHRPRPEGWHPEACCQFVDDVGRAITVAKELAGVRDVAVTAGNLGGQALALGLVDE